MREITDIHIPFKLWLDERGIPYVYHRPDKRSGIAKGHPDFTVLWCSRVIMIECKTEKAKLSADQVDRIAFLQQNGCRVEIARSVEQCCEAARMILCESGRATDGSASFPDAFRDKFREMRETVANGKSIKPEITDEETAKANQACNDYFGDYRITETRSGLKDLESTVPFYIADWKGVPFVFARNTDGKYSMIRKASAGDCASLPRL